MAKKFQHPRTIELRRIMKRGKLRQSDIARLVGCARNSVHYWLKEDPVIPPYRLQLLRLELATQRAA